jgi:chloramphenicol-sensitive protein RarD
MDFGNDRTRLAPMTERRRGLIFGFGAYGMWGLFPLYWPLLEPAGAGEILACRMLWSLVSVVFVLAALRRWAWAGPLLRTPRKMSLLLGASVCISVNWWTYIWAVNAGHVIDAALGYFLNPLVTVLFGVLILHERLRPAQWFAVGIGTAAVLELALAAGHVPWIALVLACSFGTYGLLKKLAAVPALESMAVESGYQFLPALGFLVYLQVSGTAVYGHAAWHVTLLLTLAGAVTLAPLLLFAGATNRLPLSMIGLLQFLTPVLQLLCGVLVNHETAPGSEWIGFGIVWVALAVLTADGLRQARGAGRTPSSTSSDSLLLKPSA